jgi:hypothetical protein
MTFLSIVMRLLETSQDTSLLGHFWSLLNAVHKYVSSLTTRKGVYPSKISIYKVVYKAKNKQIVVIRWITRVSGI